MAKSRVGNTLRTETNRWGRKGCKPKGAYKEVLRPSRRLALAAAKISLINILYLLIKLRVFS
jgi:hypothetical protein